MSKLTGNTRYRSNWRGTLILQVEYIYSRSSGWDDYDECRDWRDAKITDISILHTENHPDIKS